MKILVTGGCGFIGSHVVDAYIDAGHEVIVVDKNKKNINKKAEYVILDLTGNNHNNQNCSIEELFEKNKFDVVNHHAAQVSAPFSLQDPIEDSEVNTVVTVKLLELCRKHDVKKFIFSSSAAVYGNPNKLPIIEETQCVPISPYGLSKKIAEEYVRLYGELYGIQYTIFRYANAYGPRQSSSKESCVISVFVKNAVCNDDIVLFGDGLQTRDFVYVKDIVNANLVVLDNNVVNSINCRLNNNDNNMHNNIINISSNRAVSIKELAEEVKNITKSSSEIINKEERKGDIRHSVLDNAKMKKLFELKTTSLHEGLKETVLWYKQRGCRNE